MNTNNSHPFPQATCSVPVAAVDQLLRQLERIERLESALTEIINLCQVAGLGVEAQAFQSRLIAQRALKPNAEKTPAAERKE
jgi:uncharacterized protein (UPF0335 family)